MSPSSKCDNIKALKLINKGGSRGQVVMERDSCLRGRGFKSQHCKLDGHMTFFTLICCKNCIACLKNTNINKKEAGVGPFKNAPIKMSQEFFLSKYLIFLIIQIYFLAYRRQPSNDRALII